MNKQGKGYLIRRVTFSIGLSVLSIVLCASTVYSRVRSYQPTAFRSFPLRLGVADTKAIAEELGAGTAEFVRKVQEANVQWLCVHAKHQAYLVSYVWRRTFGDAENVLEEENQAWPVVGFYDRPFMSTPLSELVFYGGLFGEKKKFTWGQPWDARTGRGKDFYIVKGQISGAEAADIALLIFSPQKLSSAWAPTDYRFSLRFPKIREAKIVYRIKVDAQTYLVEEETFAIWSPDFLDFSNMFDEVHVRYVYDYTGSDGNYPSKVRAEVIQLPGPPRPMLESEEDLRTVVKEYKIQSQTCITYDFDAKIVDKLWLPFRMVRTTIVPGVPEQSNHTIIFEADDFTVTPLVQKDGIAPRWLWP